MKLFKKYLAAISTAIIFLSCNSKAQTNLNISADEFEKGVSKQNSQLLDVRTAGEYQDGHLKNAFLADWNKQDQFKERVQSLDKTKPIYVYCLSGGRSAAASAWLKQNGYASVYNLEGGINAWRRNNKAVEGANNTKQITLAEYQNQIPKNKTVLVDIGAVWCPPCKKMAPIVDSLENISNKAYYILKIDGGEQTELAKQLNATIFPTFIIYKNGKEVWRKQGVITFNALLEKLN